MRHLEFLKKYIFLGTTKHHLKQQVHLFLPMRNINGTTNRKRKLPCILFPPAYAQLKNSENLIFQLQVYLATKTSHFGFGADLLPFQLLVLFYTNLAMLLSVSASTLSIATLFHQPSGDDQSLEVSAVWQQMLIARRPPTNASGISLMNILLFIL